MDGHGQHPRIEVERGLHTVAVMGIDVDVRDLAHPRLEQRGDAQRGVVVDAETRRVIGHRVVQSAAEVDRAIGLAAGDRPRRGHRSPGDQRRGLVHPGEDRMVRGAEPMPDREERRIGSRRPADRIDVAGGVHQAQGLVVGRARGEHLETVEHTQAPGQQPGHLPAQWAHRMVTTEVVAEHPRVPDHQRPAHGLRLASASSRLAPRGPPSALACPRAPGQRGPRPLRPVARGWCQRVMPPSGPSSGRRGPRCGRRR